MSDDSVRCDALSVVAPVAGAAPARAIVNIGENRRETWALPG